MIIRTDIVRSRFLQLCVLLSAAPVYAQTYSKIESYSYHDNASVWVLGQLETKAVNGVQVVNVGFDQNAKPATISQFGKLAISVTYHPDGTISSITDGNGNRTGYIDWKRGVPRTTLHPATPESPGGASESALVSDAGWITRVTDENGFSTHYAYDQMGRSAGVEYPVGDGAAWNATVVWFEQVWGDEWGIPPGHWRQIVATGSGQRITYFDALWRPLLVRELDANDEVGTQRFRRYAYDHEGRTTFASYPSASASPTTGIWTEYDALGRVTSSSQDSEHGLLTTTTAYVPGLLTLVTSPKGVRTYSRYMAWDKPNFDYPIIIDFGSGTPEESSLDIERDAFGKPTSIRKRSPSGSVALTRRYVYDAHQQLCKTIEPETGATIMAYDGAGNLAWSASGHHDLMDPAHCHRDEGYWWGRRVDRSYDARNRLSALSFPDGRGNQYWTYTPDGLPQQIDTWQDAETRVINFYSYNRRRQLTGESSTQVGWYAWGVGYGYNANGHQSSQTYPDGLMLELAPNALGQPTQVGPYASGVQYHPNGAVRRFTYGNGVAHGVTLNARQLPNFLESLHVQNYEYHYDAHGNPGAILDWSLGQVGHRWMNYDALDRLVSAGSASFGGDHWHRFSYDALDNLRSWTLAGVKDHAHYDYDSATRRLSGVRNSAGNALISLGYDSQGNLQQRNNYQYSFDFGNRLRSVAGVESYRYDGHGRRVLGHRGTGGWTLSMYGQSGQLLYDERHGNQTLSSEYFYLGGQLIAQRERNWSTQHARIRYHHTDALGSPVAETNESGAVVDRTHWEPYGAAIGKPNYDGVGFTGHVQDGATGLTYMQQRYYDPQLGIFLSVDPVAPHSGPVGQFHRYRYASNNPYKFVDPDGRQSRENAEPPRTGMPVVDWITTPSDQRGSMGQMIMQQLGFEISQPKSARDIALSVAVAMSAGAGPGGIGRGAESLVSRASVANGGAGVSAVARGAPRPAQNFLEPTNPAQPPPKSLPNGHSVRVMGPTQQYTDGYWVQTNQHGQPINPSTGKPPSNVTRPESRAQTHVPLPKKTGD